MKSSNKGFSLVELIIVIAIIAILVAIIAPQYVKYVEKSRVASDEELLDNIQHVIAIAVTDENIIHKPMDGLSAYSATQRPLLRSKTAAMRSLSAVGRFL